MINPPHPLVDAVARRFLTASEALSESNNGRWPVTAAASGAVATGTAAARTAR
ncbi:hypothetical protein GA0074695_3214 [Micromonospora viridifaciens]|uniref:Uncharacterized protein n=1 Tax=Micromonospora viridifaciens TaxID=1881 RepID=A0A1C4XDM2_MICVI|nr:hypothetical protein [Micromonospora viridifaciens]SCF06507.1 hypothetical protein GA0074695_3214 [Micromonospora viridifaciens]